MVKKQKFLILSFIALFSFFVIFYLIKNIPNLSFLSQISAFVGKEKNFEGEISNLKEKISLLEERMDKLINEVSNLKNLKIAVGELEADNQERKTVREESKNEKEIKICQNFNTQPKLEIIFNEICWMGSENSPTDEWIELKNISQKEINLDGWQILNKNQTIKIFFEKDKKILPGEFLVLRRGDDFTGAIKNSDETLFLFDKDCRLQDKVEATSTWPGGDNKTKRTAERKENFSWQTSEYIGGTPGKGNSMGLAIDKEKEGAKEVEAKISLNYPPAIFSQKEFDVLFSVSDLKYDTYDIKIAVLKISDETEQQRTISEISLTGEEWQDSYKYLTNVFTGNYFSGKFKLRINQDFSGPAEIITKIRNLNKKLIGEFKDEILVLKPEKKEISTSPSTEEITSATSNKESIKILVDNIPERMSREDIISLYVKITEITGNQEFKIGLSSPGEEEYPPSFTSLDRENWQWSRNYFEIIAQNKNWEGIVYLKLNPNSTRYQNITDRVLVSSRLRIDGKTQDWNYHGTILISE